MLPSCPTLYSGWSCSRWSWSARWRRRHLWWRWSWVIFCSYRTCTIFNKNWRLLLTCSWPACKTCHRRPPSALAQSARWWSSSILLICWLSSQSVAPTLNKGRLRNRQGICYQDYCLMRTYSEFLLHSWTSRLSHCHRDGSRWLRVCQSHGHWHTRIFVSFPVPK